MKSLIACLAGILGLCWSVTASALEGENSNQLKMEREVVDLFYKKDYRALEKIAGTFREQKSRTSSGLWQLATFYESLSWVLTAQPNDKTFWWNTEKALKSWIADFPESPTPHLAYATLLLNRGLSYRGEGFANTVKPQNWKPFRRYTEQARQHLEKSKPIASRDPQWYALMARVAVFQSWPEKLFNLLLTEGLDKEPRFYPTYFSAVLYHSPRWHGSVAAIETFARAALTRTKPDDGYAMYTRVYWFATRTEFGETLFKESQVNWEKMKRGIDDILRRYPDNWNLNHFAKFACLARDRKKAAQLIARVEKPLYRQVWDSSSRYHRCRAWANTLPE